MTPVDTTAPRVRLYKALSHPTRVRILRALEPGRVASPNELAGELDEELGNVSYHVRLLEKLGFVEPTGTRPARGALEHFYRAVEHPVYDTELWQQLSVAERHALTNEALAAIWDDVAAAQRSGTLDAPLNRHISRSVLQLDEQGWNELAELTDELLERAQQVAAESVNRIAAREHAEGEEAAADGAFGARLVLMLFQAAPAPRRGAKDSLS